MRWKGTGAGKCRISIFEGKYRTEPKGKLGPDEIAKGTVLACQTFPELDIIIDIPKRSRLVVGDVIEVSRAKSLGELFSLSMGIYLPS